MTSLKTHSKIILSVLHGIFLFAGIWMLTNSTYTSSADEAILRQVNILEEHLFSSKTGYPHDFVFVNVSRDQKLMADPAEYGETAITDRVKLAKFFKILADNGNRHYFALCDIFFENPSDDDTALALQAQRCKKIIFPYHITADTIEHPCIDVPVGLSDFVTYTGNFSKFKLLYKDSLKTTPLLLLEKLDQKKYPGSFLDFKSVFPRYYIQGADLLTEKKYPYFNLGELLMLSDTDSFYHQFLEDKFIVIGNFETDVHFSPVGKIPGPLILLNTYLTIRNGSAVSAWWALFFLASLSLVSYILFFKKIKAPDIRKRPWVDLLLQVFINKYISFSGICLLMVIISALAFSVQLNISLLLAYLLVVNFFKEFYKKHYKKEA